LTSVEFYLGAADPLHYCCRLVRKALAQGSALLVVASRPTLDDLDRRLWSFSMTDFLPHCTADAPLRVQRLSPVLLAETAPDHSTAKVLINLASEVPAGFDRFERLLEIVANEPTPIHLARQRWRHYVLGGYRPVKHDIE